MLEKSTNFERVPGSSIDILGPVMDSTVSDSASVLNSHSEDISGRGNCRSKRHIKKKITIGYLLKCICASRETCIEWLKSKSLIPRIMFCPKCNRKMKFEACERAVDGYIWICKECVIDSPTFSTRHGSWLETNSAPLVDILLFTYLWSYGFSEDHICKELNMPMSTLKEWNTMYSNICESVYQRKMGREEDPKNGNIADTTTKESHAIIWRRQNKYKDPFLEFLKEADSL